MKNTERTLTTGAIAKLMDVAPRTVSKWCDTGKLKCYRLPASRDRRVLWDDLRRFSAEYGVPIFEEKES